MDYVSGKARFTFGIIELNDGLGMITVFMGLFGIAEIFISIEEIVKTKVVKAKVKDLLPNLQDWKESFWPIIRGSGLGFLLGILPGGGAVISSFASYTMEKRISKHPERFGTGEIVGVAGPESANNAAAQGSFIPLLTLGIPPNAVISIILGALIIHGIRPGPLLITEHPDIFWG